MEITREVEEQIHTAGPAGWVWKLFRRGVRADILPGGMEAKKAAEANLIARREETAAMRCQANTAELLADNR